MISKSKRRRIVNEEIISNVDVWQDDVELTTNEIELLENLQRDPYSRGPREITMPEMSSEPNNSSTDDVFPYEQNCRVFSNKVSFQNTHGFGDEGEISHPVKDRFLAELQDGPEQEDFRSSRSFSEGDPRIENGFEEDQVVCGNEEMNASRGINDEVEEDHVVANGCLVMDQNSESSRAADRSIAAFQRAPCYVNSFQAEICDETEQIVPKNEYDSLLDELDDEKPAIPAPAAKKALKGRRKSRIFADEETQIPREEIYKRSSDPFVDCNPPLLKYSKLTVNRKRVESLALFSAPLMRGSVISKLFQRPIFQKPVEADLSILNDILQIRNPHAGDMSCVGDFVPRSSNRVSRTQPRRDGKGEEGVPSAAQTVEQVNENLPVELPPIREEMKDVEMEMQQANEDVGQPQSAELASILIQPTVVLNKLPNSLQNPEIDFVEPPEEFQDFCSGVNMRSSTPTLSSLSQRDGSLLDAFKSQTVDYAEDSTSTFVFKRLVELWSQSVYPINMRKILPEKGCKIHAARMFAALLCKIPIRIRTVRFAYKQ